MTKVLLFVVLLPFAVQAASRSFLRLSGFVAPKAFVEVDTFEFDGDILELKLHKNTRNMNFRMVLEPHWGKKARRNQGSGFLKEYVLSARGQKERVNLRELKAPTRRLRMTILSP